MKNILWAIFGFTITVYSYAESGRILVKVEIQEGNINFIRETDQQRLPVIYNQKLASEIAKLASGDEVYIEGHIYHENLDRLETLVIRSYFVADKIYPVSLRALGIGLDSANVIERTFQSDKEIYSPIQIPITTEVASAITFTTSFLLLNDLTTNPDLEPKGRTDIRRMLFLSAGSMATLTFIYDQIKGKTIP